jgi:hypothetical protein
VADVLAIEDTDFVKDGLRWWSATSGPKLWGSYEGGPDAVVQVKVGAGAALLAAVNGSVWNVQLPAGTIMADTLISVTLTDPARGVVSLEQVFSLDSAAPVFGLGASKTRNERGDVIDFSTQVPVHDHQGPEIDLGADGCPTVYKYSYLMDTHAPVHGGETAPNRITWNLTLQDTKLVAADFLVRDQAGTVVRDWRPIVGTGTSFPLTLYRDGDAGIGDLATKPGKYTIEVRARDWGGLESTASYCIDFQPLAAPLQISQALTPTDPDALKSWTLVANSPISRVTKPGAGAAIAEQKIMQYSSEPVALQLAVPALSGTWRMQFYQGWIESEREKIVASCSSMNCDPMPAPASLSSNGTLSAFSSNVELVDHNGALVAPVSLAGYVIPGRAVGAPPAEYRVRVRLSDVTHYGHNSVFFYDERITGALNYTGTAPAQQTAACAAIDSLNRCIVYATYHWIRGMNTIGLTLQPIVIGLAVGASQASVFGAPAHVPAATFVSPAVSWDGGDENSF